MKNVQLLNSVSFDSHNVAGTDTAGSGNSMEVYTNNSTLSTHKPFPIKLENKNANVCFFNSIVQVLYSLPLFHTYLEQTTITNVVVNSLKNLFKSMKSANEVIVT